MLVDLLLIQRVEGSDRLCEVLKGGHLMVKDEVRILQESPRLLAFNYADYYKGINPIFQEKSENVPEGANALLLGERVEGQDMVYYSASYCRIPL